VTEHGALRFIARTTNAKNRAF